MRNVKIVAVDKFVFSDEASRKAKIQDSIARYIVRELLGDEHYRVYPPCKSSQSLDKSSSECSLK